MYEIFLKPFLSVEAFICCRLPGPSLHEVNISENPIGVGGATALLSVNLSEGHRLSIDIRGCSLKVRDPTCWFDATKVSNEFVLKLDSPYERAVCVELLRLAAGSDEYKIEKFTYFESDADANGRDVEFSFAPITRKDKGSVDDGSFEPKENVLYDMAADIHNPNSHFRMTFRQMFQQYDTNSSGGLDWRELLVVLEDLGMESSLEVVQKLLLVYDTDCSGIIEEEEFIHFLLDVQKQKDSIDEAHGIFGRFMYDSSSKNKQPYLPPSKGKVRITYHGHKTKPDFVKTASNTEIQALLEASKSTADSNILISAALNVLRLNFNEALKFYYAMMKDHHAHNSVTDILQKLVRHQYYKYA